MAKCSWWQWLGRESTVGRGQGLSLRVIFLLHLVGLPLGQNVKGKMGCEPQGMVLASKNPCGFGSQSEEGWPDVLGTEQLADCWAQRDVAGARPAPVCWVVWTRQERG